MMAKTFRGAGHGGITINRIELKSNFEWGGIAELVEKRKTDHLVLTVKRYEAALLRIAERPEEQKVLMEHREKTGQEVTDVDMTRYLSYLKSARIAAEALGWPEILTALKTLERDSEAGNTSGGHHSNGITTSP